jgi:hypothetical protein
MSDLPSLPPPTDRGERRIGLTSLDDAVGYADWAIRNPALLDTQLTLEALGVLASTITEIRGKLAGNLSVEQEQWRHHSMMMTELAWDVAQALGDIPPGVTHHRTDLRTDIGRLIALAFPAETPPNTQQQKDHPTP